jgi:hypothetical protein
MDDKLTAIIAELRWRFEALYGERLVRMILFGSQARGAECPARGNIRVTREQTALLKKARDSLHGAKLLAGDGLHDFAASRAYYAMFYVAEALPLGEGLSLRHQR